MKTILFGAAHYYSGNIIVGSQNYARQFSKAGWSVAYISTFLSPFKILFHKDKVAIQRQRENFKKNGEQIDENLWSFTPFTFIPHHNKTIFDSKWLLENYYRFSPVNFRKLLKKKGFDIPVDALWIDSPNMNFLKKLLNPRLSIYRVIDNIRGFRIHGENVIRAEDKAIEFSDIVLVASKVLTEKYRLKFTEKNIVHCPNGANLDNFIRNSYNFPSDLKGIPGKKVLYLGGIGEWFDVDLLTYAADRLPDTSFIIVGYDRAGVFRGIRHKNIYLLGRKQYSEVPDYIYHCDLGIIPFKNSELVQTVHPIKMYEFFCLGKPVVSTSWEELRMVDTPCHLAATHDQFVDLIDSDDLHHSHSPDDLVKFARSNSWSARYQFVVNQINSISTPVPHRSE